MRTVLFGAEAWPLAACSLVAGILLALGFRYTSDQTAIRRTKKKLHAHLLEIRLYIDEPAVIWRAQAQLLRANLRLFLLLLRPALILAIPTIAILAQLDAVYGHGPLEPGRPYLVTLRTTDPLPERVRLEVPPEVDPDVPAVRIPSRDEVVWRIRPLRPATSSLRIVVRNTSVDIPIVAGSGPHYKSVRRVRGLFEYLLNLTGPRLRDPALRSIEVGYPPAEIRWFRVSLHWAAWFLVLSGLSFLVTNRRHSGASSTETAS